MAVKSTQPKPKKKKHEPYFGKKVQAAVEEYILLSEDSVKNRIQKDNLFRTIIYPALDKLVENIINRYRFWKYETTYTDLKMETVGHLFEKFPNYSPEKGKAYSFFTKVTQHFLIRKAKDLQKKANEYAEMDRIDSDRDLDLEASLTNYQESLRDFIKLWCMWVDVNLDKLFKSNRDRKIADAIVTLFRDCEDIDIYSKKMLYIFIREQTDYKTEHITKVVKIIKPMFAEMLEDYLQVGFIDSEKYL